ncbi:hypothetical protein [Halomarina oriensis]|uniref:Uncharacterized protein n=1 Tax=Halomarina oriensis TaxID=671145 RepID=A0A6B0GP24_9EURY|nr:hypothetical protein [Halomarina oriensis]MWG36554.1 hypothetical protein [Halomarina oriensis]
MGDNLTECIGEDEGFRYDPDRYDPAETNTHCLDCGERFDMRGDNITVLWTCTTCEKTVLVR